MLVSMNKTMCRSKVPFSVGSHCHANRTLNNDSVAILETLFDVEWVHVTDIIIMLFWLIVVSTVALTIITSYNTTAYFIIPCWQLLPLEPK